MAIDFLVMPLSRYLSGDFVTPTMQFAWSLGKPYTLIGAVTRQIPPGEPFGGADAAARRKALLGPDMIPADLARYPAPIARQLWDETTTVEPRFHRVDPQSYGALIEASRDRIVETRSSSLFGLRTRRTAHPSHLAAALFFPVAFDEPFTTEFIFEGWLAGSAPIALRELVETSGTPETESARATLLAALEDAIALRLPIIVDT